MSKKTKSIPVRMTEATWKKTKEFAANVRIQPSDCIENLLLADLNKPVLEQTFFIIKPDAIENGSSERIFDRIIEEGFVIKKLSLVQADEKMISEHYIELTNKPFFPELLSYMTRTPVLVGVLEKENAIEDWRKLIGSTNPSDAAPGTIRYSYGDHNGFENAVHGSDSKESAKREIELWLNNN